ncbi:MAG: MFS transporter, partial [Pseudonocardiales bacterium]
MTILLDAVAPRRLGRGFRWLLASSWLSNTGDGIAIAAGPLLVASLTGSAFLIALAALLQWLPPLVFGLWAGALSDRVNRKLIVVTADLLRAAVLCVLTVTILTGRVSIALVLATLFVLGTAEVFADNTSSTLLPMLVHRDDLAIANARLVAGFITVNQLVGPPIGAALFAAGTASPFVTQAVLVALGAILVSRIALPAHVPEDRSTRAVRLDIAEGIRWVRHHPAVRTLVLTIFTFNITFGAAWSVLVLYATHRLGLGSVGFGLITTVGAVGGLVGTLSYGWIVKRVSLGDIMRIGLIIETFTHLGLAITTSPWVAMPIFFVFGAHAFIWGTTSITVRQRAVPTALQGRVGSVNTVGVFGGLVIGSAIGGLLAQHLGIAAPFWFAFAGSGLFVVLIW